MSGSKRNDDARGLFIALEGVEGSGKSTQAARLALRLSEEGREVVLTREPGGPPFSERIRGLLLDGDEREMCPKTELFLYLASRAQHVCRLIAPALTEGCCVVCDRYSLASVAYQGAGRELGVEQVTRLCNYASDGLWPDVTFVLDLDPEVGLRRKKTAGHVADRLEQEHIAFHIRVRQAYLAWASEHPEHVVVLDGGRPRDELEKAIWREVAVRMPPARR